MFPISLFKNKSLYSHTREIFIFPLQTSHTHMRHVWMTCAYIWECMCIIGTHTLSQSHTNKHTAYIEVCLQWLACAHAIHNHMYRRSHAHHVYSIYKFMHARMHTYTSTRIHRLRYIYILIHTLVYCIYVDVHMLVSLYMHAWMCFYVSTLTVCKCLCVCMWMCTKHVRACIIGT